MVLMLITSVDPLLWVAWMGYENNWEYVRVLRNRERSEIVDLVVVGCMKCCSIF